MSNNTKLPKKSLKKPSHSLNIVEERNFYNPKNKLVTKDYIESLLKTITGLDLKIKTLYCYQLAFTHPSVYKKNIAPPGEPEVIFYQTYESLEFVGDAWFNAICADYLYHRFPGQGEGFLTKLRTKIVCSKQMAKYAEYLGMAEYVLISPKVEKIIGRNHIKVLEDIFESLCAAIKQDLGIPILEIFVKNIIEATTDFTHFIMYDDDYKTLLLQYYQKHGWMYPTYSTISHGGSNNNRTFVRGVDYIPELSQFGVPPITIPNGSQYLATAQAHTKKDAEQEASLEALIALGVFKKK